MADPQEQPLELILARNLVSIITLPAVPIDVEGTIVFYNDAAIRSTRKASRSPETARLFAVRAADCRRLA
jgi:hypothetical protein